MGQIGGLVGLKRGGPRAGNLNKSFLARKSANQRKFSAVQKGQKCMKEGRGGISYTSQNIFGYIFLIFYFSRQFFPGRKFSK
jgi:hypothetical protein